MNKLITHLIVALAYASFSEAKEYTVKKGDNLGEIAETFERSLDDLLVCNPKLSDPDYLKQDQVLKLSIDYAVKTGDSLWSIARTYGTTVSEILSYNNLADADEIQSGTVLELPCRKSYSVKAVSDAEKQTTGKKKAKKNTGKTIRYASGLELEIVTDPHLIGKGQEFYDPNHADTPLVKVPRSYLTKKVSEHFHLAEFAAIPSSSLVAQKYKQRFAGDNYFTYIRLDPDFIEKLEQLREKTRRPLEINSGYRSNGYNTKLYRQLYHRKPTKSRHISGDASDLAISQFHGKTRRQFLRDVDQVFKKGGVGKGSTFVHVDDRGRKARWRY